jgi:hypothetical protein
MNPGMPASFGAPLGSHFVGVAMYLRVGDEYKFIK